MNLHTLRLFVALLFLSAASPSLAQTNGAVPPAIWTQVAALGSGLYDPSLDPITAGNPPNPPDAAYYGTDQTTYAASSTALHIDAAKIPTLIFEVELDPLPMLIANGNLYSLLCHRDNQCPLMYRFLMHDHISAPTGINTGDETVSMPLLNFIRAR